MRTRAAHTSSYSHGAVQHDATEDEEELQKKKQSKLRRVTRAGLGDEGMRDAALEMVLKAHRQIQKTQRQ